MSLTAAAPDRERGEAARLASLLLRFANAVGHPAPGHKPPDALKVGSEAFIFGPSWTPIPIAAIESFLFALPCPVLLSSTLTRGVVTLTLVEDLTGDRRRWAEKTLSNGAACLDSLTTQLGLAETAPVLVEFEDESHVFSVATIRYWAQHLPVEIGWNLGRLEGEPRAEACMLLIRADGKPFPGRSSMLRPGWRRSSGDAT